MTTPNKQQVTGMLKELNRNIEFAAPQNVQQMDMLEALENLTPQQRTELMTDCFTLWNTWHTQFALQGV